MSLLPGARCPTHQAAAVGTCTRCGAFVCDGCTRWQAEQRFCVGCAARLGERPSRAANVALLVSTFGLCVGVPGIFGLVLAQQELGRIARGEAPAAGKDTATLARNLGVVSIVLTALLIVWAARELGA